MSSIFSDGALHPGRDANDAWWIVVRRPDDWGVDPEAGETAPRPDRTRYDVSRMVLELAPLPLAASSIAPPEVSAPDGTRYVLDAANSQILRQRACDPEPAPLPGVGGPGWMTGCFCRPAALALDERGWLYVVDRGNHRVQIIDPTGLSPAPPHDSLALIDPGGPGGGPARVVAVLGGVDAWGRPVAGEGRGRLDDPVAIAIGPRRIYVATSAGWIHPYDRQLRAGARFQALRPGAASAEIVAIAATGDDLVVVAEAGWSRLSRFDCRGGFAGEVDPDAAPPALRDAVGRARFALEGTRIVGPIDGGIDGLAWHQVIVDAVLPEGTQVEVQTWAADATPLPPPSMAAPPALPAVTPWGPELPVAIPAEGEPARGEVSRLVLSDTSAWQRWRAAPYRRGAAFALAGTGPHAGSTMTAPADRARRLRAGDQIELRAAAATATAEIASISPRAIALIATGDRAAYTAGAELWLVERGGRAIDEARIATLLVGEAIDLTAIAVDGGGADVAWPHGCAAVVRRGDVLELRQGTSRAVIEIEAIDPAPAVIALAAPVAGDLRTANLRLVEPAGRLVLEHADGWGEGFPHGDAIDVAYLAGGELQHATRTVAWSDPELATVWTTAAPPAGWISIAPADEPRATDRGRYLWVKLRLRGARRHPADPVATATPVVRSLRVVGPRQSYLAYLPAVLGRRDDDAPTGAVFLERFLALFEGRLTQIEGRYEAIARLLNPLAADDEWLRFVASWFDLVLDPAWPRARRARLLAQIFSLYRLRGTPEGIARFVEAYTGQRPELIEGFQVRPRAGMVLGCAAVLGCAPVGGLDVDAATAEELLARYAHRFTLVAHVDDECDLDIAELSLRALVEAVKPAHTDVDLRLALPHGRIGLESTIGVDFILGDDRRRDAPIGGAGALGTPAPILGVSAHLLAPRGSTPALAEGGAEAVGSFTIR